MDSRWFKGKTKGEAKEARKKDVQSFRRAFGELTELLKEEFEDTPTPDYNNPSWAYKQADINGANRMLRQIMKLIDIK